MILSEIKDYVKTRRQSSLSDIALHFDAEPEAVRGMLQFWVNKGRIKKHQAALKCAGSCHCSQKNETELYEWNAQFGDIPIDIV